MREGRDEASRKRRRQQVACLSLSPTPMARDRWNPILCQLFSQSGRARPPGPLGSCRGRRTDAWTGQSVSSPISLLPPPPVIQTIWTFTYYAPDEMRHILMAPAAVRVRQCDRIGDDELDAADWLSASVLALPPGPSCAVLCPVRFRDPVGRASSLVTC